MSAALILSPESPYPAAGGGALRTASIFEYLAARYAVDLIVFREAGAPDPRLAIPAGRARDVAVIDLPYHSRNTAARAARNVSRYLRGAPPLNDRFAGFEQPIARFLENREYVVAVLEHFWCAPYVELAKRHAGRVILDLHNLESAYYLACARAERWPSAVAFRRFASASASLERRWLPQFQVVLAPSHDDACRIRGIVDGARVEACPNAIPETPLPRAAEEDVIAFSGNLAYGPNTSAVRWFAREIWPALRVRRPGLVWRIVGRKPEAIAKYVAGLPGVEVTGPVEDAVLTLASAKIVVVPLLAGSGTRFKILEAWAAARAVVSTSIGAEGLDARDGQDLALADSPDHFAGAVCRLLDDCEARKRLGTNGRLRYEREFTWRRVWDILETIGV